MKFFQALFLSITLFCNGLIFTPQLALAQTNTDDVCEGVKLTGGGCEDDGSISKVIQTIINILSIITGVVAVIMIIIGGLRYVTSAGDSNNLSSAKNTILYAIIGLVVVAMAQVIVRFVISKI